MNKYKPFKFLAVAIAANSVLSWGFMELIRLPVMQSQPNNVFTLISTAAFLVSVCMGVVLGYFYRQSPLLIGFAAGVVSSLTWELFVFNITYSSLWQVVDLFTTLLYSSLTFMSAAAVGHVLWLPSNNSFKADSQPLRGREQ